MLEEGADLSTIFAKDGLLKELTKNIVERALQVEMEEHLGYRRYGRRSEEENVRNGSFSKNLITDNGVIELSVPRDREDKFEPVIVPKKQSRIEGLDQKILSLVYQILRYNCRAVRSGDK